MSVLCGGAAVDPGVRKNLFDLPDPGATGGARQIDRLRIPMHLAFQMVERHEGQIWSEEAAGNGLRLRLHLPHEPSASTIGEDVEDLLAFAGRESGPGEPAPAPTDTADHPPDEQLSV
jgi:hypothetical protein